MRYFLIGLMLFLFGCGSKKVEPIGNVSNSSYSLSSENKIFLKLDTGGHTALIRDIIVTKSGDIITTGDDKTIRVWDSKIGKEKRKILGNIGKDFVGSINAMALSPDEKYLVVGGTMDGDVSKHSKAIFRYVRLKVGIIRVYDYQSGKIVKNLKSHEASVTDLSFSEDGKYLISASVDKTAKIWNMKNFSLEDTINYNGLVYSVKITKKNNDYIALIGGNNKELILYSLKGRNIFDRYQSGIIRTISLTKKYIAINNTLAKKHPLSHLFRRMNSPKISNLSRNLLN